MTTVTVLAEHEVTVDAAVDDGQVLVERAALVDALGWEAKPEGLCRGDRCVPFPGEGERVDLVAAARALGARTLLDPHRGVLAVSTTAEDRAVARSGTAPDFTLPDLDGVEHRFHGWSGTKRLLFAFSSW